jgi:hypothetical protein
MQLRSVHLVEGVDRLPMVQMEEFQLLTRLQIAQAVVVVDITPIMAFLEETAVEVVVP